MRRGRSGWVWGGRALAAAVVIGLVVYLSAVGLDKADKIASVVAALAALGALAAPYLLPSKDQSASAGRSTQSVTNTMVAGHLTQARNTRGVQAQGTAAAPRATAPPPPDGAASQYVDGVWVGGNLTQVDGADGNVTCE